MLRVKNHVETTKRATAARARRHTDNTAHIQMISAPDDFCTYTEFTPKIPREAYLTEAQLLLKLLQRRRKRKRERER